VPKLRDRLSYTSAGHDPDIARREFRFSATITSSQRGSIDDHCSLITAPGTRRSQPTGNPERPLA
jgi:hypothetical protein